MPVCEAVNCSKPATDGITADGRTGLVCQDCCHKHKISWMKFPGWEAGEEATCAEHSDDGE